VLNLKKNRRHKEYISLHHRFIDDGFILWIGTWDAALPMLAELNESDDDEDFCFAPLFEAGLLEAGSGSGLPACILDQFDTYKSGAGRRRVQTGGDAACSMADFDLMVIEDNWDAISDGCAVCASAVSNDRELFMGCFDYPDPEPGQCDNGDDRSAGHGQVPPTH
jgi:hypothetical protein